MMTLRRRTSGFTLIEIMIVIVIISILLIIILPNMVKGKYQAQWSACVQYERNIAAALESYKGDQKTYPNTGQLVRLTQTTPPFINGIPTCPSTNASYGYTANSSISASGQNDIFTIYCQGVHYLVLPHVSQYFPQYDAERGVRQKNDNE